VTGVKNCERNILGLGLTALLAAALVAALGCNSSGTKAVTVKVVPTLTSIAIQPPAPDVLFNGTQLLAAWGSYSDGRQQNITDSVAWYSSDADIATITASGGLATGVAPGTTTVGASYASLSGLATLTVYFQISAILIAPASQALAPKTGTTPEPFIVTGILPTNGSMVDISSGSTLTVYLNGAATPDIACSYNATGPEGPGQYCSGDGEESSGTYQVVASYTGTSITATATLNVP
jgi:hypothetical protein